VPVYNGARYLSAALDSLLTQTFEDFEIIISDNASNDATAEIARAYAAADRRVRYHRNEENIGSTRNYNHVVALARGEFFRWAAADDLSGPEFLAVCIDALDRNDDLVLAYPRTQLIDADGSVVADYDDRMHLVDDRPSERFITVLQELRLCNVIYGLTRTGALRKTSGLRPFVGSDTVYFAELVLHGRVLELPQRLFFRRMHAEASNSMTDEERNNFYRPGTTRTLYLRTWRHHWEHSRSLMTAPIPARERFRAGKFLLRSAIWNRDRLAGELVQALSYFAERAGAGVRGAAAVAGAGAGARNDRTGSRGAESDGAVGTTSR
jgi:glycosyltransferase involved in cell wall biosynthesis